jgi:hypothetical protein
MEGVVAAEPAVLTELELVRGIPLVLGAGVIAPPTLFAGKAVLFTHFASSAWPVLTR